MPSATAPSETRTASGAPTTLGTVFEVLTPTTRRGEGLRIPRRFTRAGLDPFDTVRWEKRASRIRDEAGNAVFELKEAEVPSSWSQVATDVIVSKYFRRAGVPQTQENGTPKTHPDGTPVLGGETSAKQTIHRLATAWRWWGERYGYFASHEDATAFEDEMRYMLVYQMASPNSPQWFNTGLALAYGITGPAQGHWYVDQDKGELRQSEDAYTRSQAHACFIQSVKDSILGDGGIMSLVEREARIFKYGSGTGTNFSTLRAEGEPVSAGGVASGLMSWLRINDRAAAAIKSGGTTRRAAKMVIVDMDHPDVEQFIWWKANEEKKVAALVAAGYPSDFNGEAYLTVSGQNSNNTIRVTNEFLRAVETDADWHLRWRVDRTRISKTVKARALWRQVAEAAWRSADPGVQYDTTIQEWHTCPASGRINATNPCCVTGDTLVAVADGRNAVPIKDLVGQEVPVYTWDHARQRATISRMWNIGVKRIGASVFRVTLDDGSSFRATDDHLIMLRDGSYRQVRDLQPNDSLMPFHSKVRRHAGARTPRRFVHSGLGWRAQYRWIWERVHGKQPAGFHIHHQNYNSLDDRLENLALITKERHTAIHRERMLGDRNPARRLMNDAWRMHVAMAVRGENNPHYGKPHTKEVLEKMRAASARRWSDQGARRRAADAAQQWMDSARRLGKRLGRRPGTRMTRCCPVCRENFQTPREGHVFCSAVCRYSPLGLHMIGTKHGAAIRGRHLTEAHRGKLRAASVAATRPEDKRRAQVESLRARCLKAVQAALRAGFGVGLDSWDALRGDVRALGVSHVPQAATLHTLFRSDEELRDAAAHYNHRVVSVTKAGSEDVYDGTVDGHRNFGIVTSRIFSPVTTRGEDFSGVFIHNSEYVFLDETACNLASINLMKFVDPETGAFDVEGYVHAIRLWTAALEITVAMAQLPSREIARGTYNFRTLGLGYANLGTLLMVWGVPYDSPEARAIAGALTAILTGESYTMSAEIAAVLGPFPEYEKNREFMLRVIRNHRRAAYDAPETKYEGLTVKPVAINQDLCPEGLRAAAHRAWDRALERGEQHGYRNAQVTVIAPTGTIGLQMDCDTTGVEPDFALVKFKKLAGGGYFKIVNHSVPRALKTLGYASGQIADIVQHITGTLSFGNGNGGPHALINREVLLAKGFTDADIGRVEAQLPGAFHLSMACAPAVLGGELLARLGLAEKAQQNPVLNVLEALGFTTQQIEEANAIICGRQTIEGAPHLNAEHLPAFDCANRCGPTGQRFIAYGGHVNMLAAVQPFVSGSISKTINMPAEATVEDVARVYWMGWQLGLKANALYRDGSKLSQPLSTKSSTETTTAGERVVERIVEKVVERPHRLKLPRQRQAITRKVDLGGHEFYLTVGLYPDGKPGELFITMGKEGTFASGLADAFAKMVSIALQYGVPLENVIRQLRHMRFSPEGFTGDPDIPTASSVADFLARWLDKTFPGGRHVEMGRLPLPEGTGAAAGSGQSAVGADHSDAATAELNLTPLDEGPASLSPAPGVVVTFAAQQPIPGYGFTGDKCGDCGSLRMVKNGTCAKCLDCGTTTGCS